MREAEQRETMGPRYEEMMADEMLRQDEANARAAMQGRPVTPPRGVEPRRSPGPRRTRNIVYKEALA
ncbi:uncharacterized protein MICPUCDRAFT_54874 [Micromonas pusilla CCMP1545]|nr:uncharacterized protein MICPUCDRAFT_54874 [Micromonas pusilla CCMP1545]EEH50932.1 predicted protein [Micromonas pusilla CCMP1545]|eukprot:XP_003064952.1 predicted protein [Micromonas pusilla CCMP1545]